MVNLVKPHRLRDRKYRQWVMKNTACVVRDHVDKIEAMFGPQTNDAWNCEGHSEFHHVKPYGGGIMGSKVSDWRGVRVCLKHHNMAARRATFERDFQLDLEKVISELNRDYSILFPEKPKMRKKIVIEHCVCGKSHTLYSCPVKS